ncbi:hypothetical protein L596_019757 [Steinernema carpocapsae]|uniref:G-protein coupled receptors family 1 profile domain-containing protein n=1 Tax=Steinernema carpocapsae TaxID=34508 RepID=A0A4U5MRM5_STECR|nr:hypothetical protein L596_019757 [Steinernema carpocapsae]
MTVKAADKAHSLQMAESHGDIYNWLFNATAIIHIPVKLFTIYVVASKTTAKLRFQSYFILNVLVWNFLANLLVAFVHVYPAFPSLCFRLSGPLSLPDSELFGHIFFALVIISLINGAVAVCTSFPFRYLMLKCPQIGNSHKKVILVVSASLHLIITLIFMATYMKWPVMYDNYPEPAQLPSRPFLFCLHPNGWQKAVPVLFLFIGLAIIIAIGLLFAVLIFVELYFLREITSQNTLTLQKRLLWYLVALSGISLIMGGVPLIVIIFTTFYPKLHYAPPMFLVSTVIAANHGTIYAIVSLAMMKSYRTAVEQMVHRLFKLLKTSVKMTQSVTPVVTKLK